MVYRIASLKARDSVSIDARKTVLAREEEMGVLACRLATPGPSITCTDEERGVALHGAR